MKMHRLGNGRHNQFTLLLSSTRFNVAMWIKIMASYSHKFACIFASIWSFLVLFGTFLALFGSFYPKLKLIKKPSKVLSILG